MLYQLLLPKLLPLKEVLQCQLLLNSSLTMLESTAPTKFSLGHPLKRLKKSLNKRDLKLLPSNISSKKTPLMTMALMKGS